MQLQKLSQPSTTLGYLKTEISKIELMLDRNNQKQSKLLSIVNRLRETRSIDRTKYSPSFIAIDSRNVQDIIEQFDSQLISEHQTDEDCCSETLSICTNDFSKQSNPFQQRTSSTHISNPSIYNNLLDRIQWLESSLSTNKCNTSSLLNYNNNAQTNPNDRSSIPSVSVQEQSSSAAVASKEFPLQSNNNLKQPIIMQGYINSQPVTLFNPSAVDLITKLKQVRVKRNSLDKSYKNVLELLFNRDKQLSEMNTILNEYIQQLQSIENLKTMEDIIQNQNWDEMYRFITHMKSRSLFISKLLGLKDLNVHDNIKRFYDIVNMSAVLSNEVSVKSNGKEIVDKERKRSKKETKLIKKKREKKEPLK